MANCCLGCLLPVQAFGKEETLSLHERLHPFCHGMVICRDPDLVLSPQRTPRLGRVCPRPAWTSTDDN